MGKVAAISVSGRPHNYQHGNSKAHVVGVGPTQDCGRAKGEVGASQGTTREEGSLRGCSQSPLPVAAGFVCKTFLNCNPVLSAWDYEGWTDCKKPASFAVALYCGIGSSSLNALVNAFERLHMVRGWNSS